MDKYSFLKNLNLDNEIINIIENDIFLENYSIGEEVFNPEIPINKVSIILSGSIRQIRRDSTKNTNIYKYVKNDLLFNAELIYELKNSFYYIAADDLKLISIEKESLLRSKVPTCKLFSIALINSILSIVSISPFFNLEKFDSEFGLKEITDKCL